MKKIGILFLLCIYLLTASGFNELLKLKALGTHYTETKVNDKSLNFLHFLIMHYVTDDNNTADDSKDQQLPFKSVNPCFGLILFSAPHQLLSFSNDLRIDKNDFFVENEGLALLNYPTQIWHPPKASIR